LCCFTFLQERNLINVMIVLNKGKILIKSQIQMLSIKQTTHIPPWFYRYILYIWQERTPRFKDRGCYPQNAWTDVPCSNKWGKACYTKWCTCALSAIHKTFSLDWSKCCCALQHYVTFYLSHDKTSFQMARQMSFRNANSMTRMVTWFVHLSFLPIKIRS